MKYKIKFFVCNLFFVCLISSTFFKLLAAQDSKTFFNQETRVQNSEKQNFDIVPVSTLTELDTIKKKFGLDYRVTKEDTTDSLSSLKGITLDYEHIRSQVFAIKDGSLVVGVATLIVTPSKYFSKKCFLKREDNYFLFKTINEILDNNEYNFIIEPAWLFLLPEYRNKNLGLTILNQVFMQTGKQLFDEFYKDTKNLVLFFAQGRVDRKMSELIRKAQGEYLSGDLGVKVEIPAYLNNLLGEINPQSTFTLSMAESFNFETLPVYDFSLGPVFMKKLEELF